MKTKTKVDVTTPFNLSYQDATDSSIDVTYALTGSADSLELKGSTMYPLGSGTALFTVRCKSLERKALLGIAYGTPWSGATATTFDSGQGTSTDPYLIRNVEQLALVVDGYTYNNTNTHFKLANDLFMNLHLLGEDEKPRSNATKWTPGIADFRGNLDGDGHTIYGLYVKDDNCSSNTGHGLFPELKGSISRLAVVDSYVWANAFYKIPQLTSIYIDNPKPEGAMATLETDGIVAADDCTISVYINDGSYNDTLYNDYKGDDSWEDFADNGRLFRYFPLTVTSAGWATLYIGFATQLPSEMKAYIVTESSATTHEATLQRVDNLVPATTPLVVKCETPGTYLLSPYTGTVNPINKWENKLIGSNIGQEDKWGVPVNQSDASQGSILTLGRNSNGDVGFYYYRGTSIPPYRAYLTYNNIQSVAAYFTFVINDDTTGINNLTPNSLPKDEGHDYYYTLSGRRIEGKPTQKGLYIYKGRKAVIK